MPRPPPKVEYSLTERGRSLEPVLLALKVWGDAYAQVVASPIATDKAGEPDRSTRSRRNHATLQT